MNYPKHTQNVRKQIVPDFRYVVMTSVLGAILTASGLLWAQTGGTGGISGTVADPTGAMVMGAQVRVTNAATGETRVVQSNDHGMYIAPLLQPGRYTAEVTKQGFKTVSMPDVQVTVAETKSLTIRLETGAVMETITVATTNVQLQTESSELGRVTDSQMVENLPLVTRNFTQIIGLNPGVAQEANNAAAIGRGAGGMGASPNGGSILSQGATSVDNNFQMNGLSVNDAESSPAGNSPGAPIPNPDTIQEFKVRTGQYDATQGRNAGAAVDVITKGGTNEYHATLWEFFRNEALNANEWFAKRSSFPRLVLRQNQYGFTAGGPLIKNKLLLFGSWQGTQQTNAADPLSHKLLTLPPLTDDRSYAGLLKVFKGATGYLGAAGGTVGAGGNNGTNIAPQAYAMLNAKLPNGQYVVPTPQKINPTLGLDVQGTTFLAIPGTYSENQWMANADYLRSDRNKLAFRYFGWTSRQDQTLQYSAPGFDLIYPTTFLVASIGDTFILRPNLLNQLQVGYHRSFSDMLYTHGFTFKDLGMNAPAVETNYPFIGIVSSGFYAGTASAAAFLQFEYKIADTLSWNKGKHQLTLGGNFSYGRDNMQYWIYPGSIYPLTWADFLLGQAHAAYGLSNIYQSLNLVGDTARDWRYKQGAAFIQDDFKVSQHLTLNLGLRYEHLGHFGDAGGRMGNTDASAIDPTPPAGGTVQGYVVGSNYNGGPLPKGVKRAPNTFALNGDGQDVWNPRLGFAWMLPGSDRFLLRGGAGMYHTTLNGQMNLQISTSPPYASFNWLVGAANGNASVANPFPASPTLPGWPSYSPTTTSTLTALAMDWRPPTTYHYSLGLQSRLPGGAILDVGFGGARNLHQTMVTSVNQAGWASPSHPIRGVTTNTIANVTSRIPYQGWAVSSAHVFRNEGQAWYNALQTSLSQQWKNKLQYQAAYTWARLLSPTPGTAIGINTSTIYGDQNNLRANYGPDPLMRPQRFVLSAYYALPDMTKGNRFLVNALSGWNIASVALVQAGRQWYIAYNNSYNVFGYSYDRPSFAAGCSAKDLPTSGSVNTRVTKYVNKSCLTTPAVIGDDGIGTGFGNTPYGVIRGPAQSNIDFTLGKTTQVHWPKEGASVNFRADFFNALNHPNFADPNLTYSPTATTFGTITATNTNPRVIQFALKFGF